MKNIINAIIEYFKNNEDIFNACIEELDSYNGYLGDDRYYEMYMLDELYEGETVTEILTRAFYGHDDETFTLNEDGTKNFSTSAFNPNREYFYFNGYGNLVSSDYKDHSAHLDEYAVNDMLQNRQHIDTIDSDDKLCKLFNQLEEA